ncbi:glycoside hydrolase family 125 protein [Jiangella aurantiaca]|uniref:Glycoside hydrolase family 125 protein n=2 Tax=Jiangella aurantiaca TaxID=2530373 RepID=A0A4R5AGJ1_9ACTN|nr:glycoside hydrolase family 125 protein [Jiangella aurantiaca]
MTDTLEKTARVLPDGTTYVITGDIPAMWLRDSTAQFSPFLLMMSADDAVQDLIAGLVRRQLRYICLDPYANAFNAEPSGAAYDPDDLADNPWVWEEKYEIDSLAFPLQLAYRTWRMTGRRDFLDDTAHRALRTVVRTWRVEQEHETASRYRFRRHGMPPTETLTRDGLGSPVGPTGMTWSGFRPSDDACTYGYNVPGNLFAATALDHVRAIAREVFHDDDLAGDARALRDEIRAGVERFGVVDHPSYGRIYAYEVDGLGGQVLMDDANLPSLLSLPHLGATDLDDPVYQATRAFVLGPDNPYHHAGRAARGVGSAHTPPGYIWPIALAVEGLTSPDPAEKLALIQTLRDTDAGTLAMHEAFHCDDAGRYTRDWFSWGDSMFCELVLDYCGHRVSDAVREGRHVQS